MAEVTDTILAGALSGVFTRFLGSPLDLLKVRLQLQLEPTSTIQSSEITGRPKYRGLFHAAKTILKEEGIRAFWKGFLAGQALYVVFNATQFTAYKYTRDAILKSSREVSTSGKTAVDFVSGCVAGGAATATSFPFDVLRTRLLSQGEPKLYPNLYRGIVMMYSENGLRTFYNGLSPALLSVAPQAGIYFTVFKMLCTMWESWATQIRWMKNREGVQWLVCGGVAGVSSKVVTLPLDMVKKRLEIQGFEQARKTFGLVGKYKGPMHCLVTIYRREGVLAFYKGTSPAILKAALGVSLSFTIYEKILKALKQLRTH